MTDFIAAILEIEKHGPLSRLLATLLHVYLKCNKKRTEINTAIIIGGNIVQNIIEDFIAKLQLIKPSDLLTLSKKVW
jgi:uncharacterized protein YejL (UPF0352 family)